MPAFDQFLGTIHLEETSAFGLLVVLGAV